MKKTVFYDSHLNMGGKMVPFAGYMMPVEFSGVKNEHVHVRRKVGVFDVSHMGEIWATGPKSKDFVQRVTSNDVHQLEPGKVQYSCLPNGRGGIVDDLLVYMFDEEKYLLVVNASNVDKDWKWLREHKTDGMELSNVSEDISQLAVQGPDAHKVLQEITPVDLNALHYYHFIEGEMAGIQDVLISNTGYTGAGGFELYVKNENGVALLDAVMKAGKKHDIIPAGLASRDTLRLEMGFCLYGNDIDETTSPLEAGLGWITKFVDGNEFIDRKYLEQQKEEGLKRKLAGFELLERGIPRKGYRIFSQDDEYIGDVTSGTMSPLTSKAIGMGYLKVPFNKKETPVYIEIRNKKIPAKVVRPPFYSPA